MKRALLRVDGSHHLGMGHIMRCLALARGLDKIGVKPIFAMKDYQLDTTDLIRHFKYEVATIPRDADCIEDARLTSEFISSYSVRLVIVDLGHSENKARGEDYYRYLKLLKATDKFLIIIDHFGTAPSADVQVIPYYGAENAGYENGSGARLLLGPAYFIFRQEFVEAAKITREIKQEAHKLLITMGGSDPLQITQKVARAITVLNAPLPNLRIVIGPGFAPSAKQEIEEILRQYHKDYQIVAGDDKMSHLMLWSDLAVTSGGLTKYETAVTGTPSIAISQHVEEAEMTEEFASGGSTLHLGLGSQVTEKEIAAAIEALMKDQPRRAAMSESGRRIVDGQGLERLISAIPREILL